MKTTLNMLILSSLLLPYTLISRKENYYWYFGYYAGITFNTMDGKPKALTDGQIDTWEGCASISDSLGNLLFYTNGEIVWNKKSSNNEKR